MTQHSGIVVNAASAALYLNVRGHGSSVFRDGKRLVLVLFLFSAALWAQIDFITTLIDPTAPQSCQIGIIFTTAFDQLARYSIEQHLLWVINDGKASLVQYIFQAVMAGRFILGAVFVGLTKSEFNSACVATTSVFVMGVVVVVVDLLILAGLAARAVGSGLFGKAQERGQESARGKAVIVVLVGLAIWMAVSLC